MASIIGKLLCAKRAIKELFVFELRLSKIVHSFKQHPDTVRNAVVVLATVFGQSEFGKRIG